MSLWAGAFVSVEYITKNGAKWAKQDVAIYTFPKQFAEKL